jgi:hypothetical protein
MQVRGHLVASPTSIPQSQPLPLTDVAPVASTELLRDLRGVSEASAMGLDRDQIPFRGADDGAPPRR